MFRLNEGWLHCVCLLRPKALQSNHWRRRIMHEMSRIITILASSTLWRLIMRHKMKSEPSLTSSFPAKSNLWSTLLELSKSLLLRRSREGKSDTVDKAFYKGYISNLMEIDFDFKRFQNFRPSITWHLCDTWDIFLAISCLRYRNGSSNDRSKSEESDPTKQSEVWAKKLGVTSLWFLFLEFKISLL